jgi:hypothetical protein
LFCRLDNNGKPLWSVLLQDAFIGGVLVESDGNFLISGINNLDSVFKNIYTTKISPTGKVLWVYNYNNKQGQGAYGIFTCQSKDKSYLSTFTNEGSIDTIQVLKQDSNGKKLWAKQWGDIANSLGDLDMVYDSIDNSYILFEQAPDTFNIHDSVKLVKLDSNANVLKTKKYPYDDYDGLLYHTYNNQILIASAINLSATSNTLHLWKINPDLEQDSFDTGDHFTYDYKCHGSIADTISLAGADTIVIDTNTMTIVDDSTITVPNGIAQVKQPKGKIALYPNPASTTLTIESASGLIQSVTIFDMTGREVYSLQNLRSKSQSVPMNNLPAGIYIVKIGLENGEFTGKFMKE